MRQDSHNTGLLFIGVVTFLLLLVGWWVFFLVRESYRLDNATALVASGKTMEALRALGAEAGGDFSGKAQQYRKMFAAEGIVMGLLVLTGVFMLYRAILRENRLRMDQERFLTGATHRLKTPLATVRLGIDSLLAGTMPADKREHYMHAMLREIDRLEGDITNLLTAGGLVASGKGMQLTAGDLAADVLAAVESMRDRFAAADIELKVDVDEGVRVKRDSGAIRLVIHNLLDNAVKYSPAGTAVSLRLARDAGDALLTVTDTGRGISEEERPRIFERFYSGTYKGHKGGSGIGLYLVRALVESHQGTVDVVSNGDGQGCCFAVRLPLNGGDA